MICPLCKDITLGNVDLAEGLSAKVCAQCGGYWIASYHYWKWLDVHGDESTERPDGAKADLEVKDSAAGKLCPECGKFLIRKKVGHGADFHLDRCTNCGGMWFDKNEWETLENLKLHNQVHYVFSAAWQKEVRDAQYHEFYEKRVEAELGADDYSRLQETANWLKDHPHREIIVSYILKNEEE